MGIQIRLVMIGLPDQDPCKERIPIKGVYGGLIHLVKINVTRTEATMNPTILMSSEGNFPEFLDGEAFFGGRRPFFLMGRNFYLE